MYVQTHTHFMSYTFSAAALYMLNRIMKIKDLFSLFFICLNPAVYSVTHKKFKRVSVLCIYSLEEKNATFNI